MPAIYLFESKCLYLVLSFRIIQIPDSKSHCERIELNFNDQFIYIL